MLIRTREDLKNMRAKCEKAASQYKKGIIVCCGTGCLSSGSMKIYERLKELLEEKNIPCSIEMQEDPHGDQIAIKKSGCHGFCEMGTLIRIEPQGWLYVKVKIEDCEEIVEKTIINGEHIERLAYKEGEEVFKKTGRYPFL
jgi:NADH-quinone oxidoreductase subunit F